MIDIFIIRIHEKKYISEWMSGTNIYRNLHMKDTHGDLLQVTDGE